MSPPFSLSPTYLPFLCPSPTFSLSPTIYSLDQLFACPYHWPSLPFLFACPYHFFACPYHWPLAPTNIGEYLPPHPYLPPYYVGTGQDDFILLLIAPACLNFILLIAPACLNKFILSQQVHSIDCPYLIYGPLPLVPASVFSIAWPSLFSIYRWLPALLMD